MKRRAGAPPTSADVVGGPVAVGFEDPYEDGGTCWTNWCCPGRCAWFTPILAGSMFVMALVAIVVSGVVYMSATFPTSQTVYTDGAAGVLSAWPQNQVLAGATVPLAMTLPNNVIEFVGKQYTVDCATLPHHTITILGGSLTTTWDGAHTVATCGGPYTGFSFRVINNNYIRVTANTGVTFS